MREAVIVAYGRTPCCRARKGGLADMHPVDYAAQALLVRRSGKRRDLQGEKIAVY